MLRGRRLIAALPFAIYPLVAAAGLWPLWIHGGTRVAAGDGSGDSFQFLWNLWWLKVALVEHVTTPFVTDLLYWPQSTSLALHTLSSANGLLSIPIQLAVPGTQGLVVSLNLLTMVTFVLTGVGAHLLARAWGARPIGGFVSGLLAMFLPYRVWHLNHLNLLSVQWGLFCLLWLDRALARGAWRARLVLALFAALTLYSDVEIASYTALASVLLLIYRWTQRPRLEPTLGLVRGLAATMAIATPLVLPLLGAIVSVWSQVRLPGGEDTYSANLAAFVMPRASVLFVRESSEAFLGIAFVVVFAVMVLRVRTTAFRLWTVLGAAFFVLSLGPTLHVGHWSLLDGLMPYAWLKSSVPFVAMGRCPVRMAGMAGIFFAIAMGVGFDDSMERRVFRPAEFVRREWVPLLVLLVCLAERWPWRPVATTEVAVPEIYSTLAAEPGNFAIRPLPEGYYHRVVYMFWQTVHGHPMTSGFVARPTNDVRQSILDWQNASPADLNQRLESSGVRYVIVHPESQENLLRVAPVVQRR